jgi:hypothetical protein
MSQNGKYPILEKQIVRPEGSEYMTAVLVGDQIEFRNFGDSNYTVMFSAKVLDQLIPFLVEANFWRKANETHN